MPELLSFPQTYFENPPEQDAIIFAGAESCPRDEARGSYMEDQHGLRQLVYVNLAGEPVKVIGTYHTRKQSTLTTRLAQVIGNFPHPNRYRTVFIFEGLYDYKGEVPQWPY